MSSKHKSNIVVAAMLFCVAPLMGLELEPSLREADRLYQNGRYEEAAAKAFQIHRFFPEDFQALLVLGMSDFNAGNFLKAADWFKLADKRSPKHPLVQRYVALLREIEYRHGPLSANPDRKPATDKYESAVFFKRGFFGPGFTTTSGAVNETYATAPLALPTPYPPTESILSETIVAEIADQAFKENNYQKSFLFYSQLLASNPGNRRYLLGKASSAFHMKRYREVIESLGPILAVPQPQGFSAEESALAKNLLLQSRQEVFSRQ